MGCGQASYNIYYNFASSFRRFSLLWEQLWKGGCSRGAAASGFPPLYSRCKMTSRFVSQIAFRMDDREPGSFHLATTVESHLMARNGVHCGRSDEHAQCVGVHLHSMMVILHVWGSGSGHWGSVGAGWGLPLSKSLRVSISYSHESTVQSKWYILSGSHFQDCIERLENVVPGFDAVSQSIEYNSRYVTLKVNIVGHC